MPHEGNVAELASTRVTRVSTALLVVGLAALATIVATTYFLGIRAQKSFEAVSAARELSKTADVLRSSLLAAESSQRGYVLTANQIYLAPYATAKAEANARIARLVESMQDMPEVDAALARLSDIVDQKFAEMDESIELQRAGRQDAALATIQSNRGKALMDEANVFTSRFVRIGDERLRKAAGDQRRWLGILTVVGLIALALIVLVVAAVLRITWDFTNKLSRARNELQALNTGLELRVKERTAELAAARDRAELLMSEVNHRVANSLAMVASMVGLQARSIPEGPERKLLSEVQSRIRAVGLVHRHLYQSEDVRSVDLAEFLVSLLDQLEAAMREEGHRGLLKHDIPSVTLPTDKSVSLGVVTAELVTNAFKYAYPDRPGEVRVRLERRDQSADLTVEDDGVGRSTDATPKGTGLGSKIIESMAKAIGGTVDYTDRRPGTTARVSFPL